MQKQLLIIGNGFDLACELKSKYIDFYNSSIKGKYFFDPDNVENFWQILLCYYEEKNNKAESYNWCDIENIINKTLCLINFGVSPISGLFWSVWNSIKSPTEITDKDYVNDFIMKYCMRFCYKNFFNEISPFSKVKTSLEDKKKAFNNHLLNELKNLEKLFCKYLKSQVNDEYYVKAVNLLSDIVNASSSFKDQVAGENNLVNELPRFKSVEELQLKLKSSRIIFNCLKHTNILSFNFTRPLRYITEAMFCLFSNVHGKLCINDKDCEQCSYLDVIFGIDDKVVQSHEESGNIRLFSKTYRTLFRGSKRTVLPSKNELITVKFFGHSLNEADYSYFQSIFDYYDIYDSNISLEFYYTQFKPDAKDEITDAVYKLINEYGLTLNNKDQGKNMIHKLILENRIRIKELEKM